MKLYHRPITGFAIVMVSAGTSGARVEVGQLACDPEAFFLTVSAGQRHADKTLESEIVSC